jgi:formylglycine-generating enzyme required for sulfatase activity
VLGVMLPVLEAVAHAHRHGICHRDLKPSNLFVTDDGQVKVLDFGIARGEETTRLTRTGQWTPCTPTHYAPEFAAGKPASPSSDVYALGIVLYELLTGSLPFRPGGGSDGDALLSLIAQHVTSPLPDVRGARPDIPAALVEVLARATSKSPDERFGEAESFRVEVERVADAYVRSPSAASIAPPRVEAEWPTVESVNGGDQIVVGGTGDDAYRGTEPAAGTPVGERSGGDDEQYPGTAPVSDSTPARQGAAAPAVELPQASPPARRRRAPLVAILAACALAVVAGGAVLLLRDSGMRARPRRPASLGSKDARPAGGAAGARRIAAQCFTMGSISGDADEMPAHEVCLAAYEIDSVEVTNEAYRRCVTAGACRLVDAQGGFDEPRQPVVDVSWHDAGAYCRFAGKALPTEAQWELAARGPDGRRYPWGTAIDCGAANYGAWMECKDVNPGRPRAVGTTPRDVSPFGVRDLGGNVREWTRDWYEGGYYARSPRQSPEGPDEGTLRVVRGGSWFGYADNLRSSIRDAFPPSDRSGMLGFRCARPAR